MLTKSRVEGMFLGIAYGDALGMPFEGFKRAKIKELVPDISFLRYTRPDGHKYFNGNEAGTTTDDWSLTKLVAEGLIDAGTFSMDAIAKHHCRAIKESPTGMGNTTKEAIQNLIDGKSWKDSGKLTGEKRGLGNGVPMKVAPLAAWYLSPVGYADANRNGFNNKLVDFARMTHNAVVGVQSGIIHTSVLIDLLRHSGVGFDPFWDVVDLIQCCFSSHNDDSPETYSMGDTPDTGHNFEFEMMKLATFLSEKWTDEQLDEEFDCGSYPVIHSLPFSYAYFFRDPHSVDSMFHAVLAGGDTDSNAAFVGGMLGALNGREIFDSQPWLAEGLKDYDQVIQVSQAFCDKFAIPAV